MPVDWEQIAQGSSIPDLVKVPTPMQLFMFSAVTWNRHLIHYNTAAARSEGHADIAVQRALIGGLLGQMLTDWLGDAGSVRSIQWSVRGAAALGKPMRLTGKVVGQREAPGERLLDCEVWAENHEGAIIAPGTAVVGIGR